MMWIREQDIWILGPWQENLPPALNPEAVRQTEIHKFWQTPCIDYLITDCHQSRFIPEADWPHARMSCGVSYEKECPHCKYWLFAQTECILFRCLYLRFSKYQTKINKFVKTSMWIILRTFGHRCAPSELNVNSPDTKCYSRTDKPPLFLFSFLVL